MAEEIPAIRKMYRDPLFDRTLEEVRSQGGYGAVAAAKAEELVGHLSGCIGEQGREKFRFTRNGEHRIRNCRKVDLGCGYRIVCIRKDHRLVLLYMVTHDDCFRWIERHRTAEYDLDSVPESAWKMVTPERKPCRPVSERGHHADRLAEEYEEDLMSRVDEDVLRKVFAGLVDR